MPDKLQAYEQMSCDTAVRITKSYLEWTGFLGAVGTLYNYI